MMTLSLLAGLLLAAQTDKPQLPPLNEEQLVRLKELIRTTSTTTATLQTQLEEKQRLLARVYAQYELQERLANKLEQDIVELQKQMLANYHKMQVELRTIVEKERFEVLRQRLERAVVPPPKEPDATRPVAPPPK